MTQMTVDPITLAARVLELAQAQARAIESDDWAAFERLSGERDTLQTRLAEPRGHDESTRTLEILNEALAVDRATTQLIVRLQSQTGLRVREAHQAHSAILGYERPLNDEMHPLLLDTQR